MQQTCGKLCNNNYTREELLPYLRVTKTNFADAPQILQVLMNSGFGIQSEEQALHQLLYSNADLNNSVKLVDVRTNEIYGILIFSNYTLEQGSPLSYISPNLTYILRHFSQLNGFAFAIDERFRGMNFDKRMLLHNMDYINQYDFIWCAVDNNLKSQNYWKHLGFTEIASIADAKFYIRLQNKSNFADIYNKCQSVSYEKDYNQRR